MHKQTWRKQAKKLFTKEKQRNALASPGPHPCILVLDGLKPNYNIGKLFRSADAFGVREVHLVGIPYFDPRSAMGSFRHVPARSFETLAESLQSLREHDYHPFALVPGARTTLGSDPLPRLSAFILGHEEFGISVPLEECEGVTPLAIPQFGTVDSLNVAVAGSVVLYEYLRQHVLCTE